MNSGRDRREQGSEDEEFIPVGIDLDEFLSPVLEAGAGECATQRHQWFDPDTRHICAHRGAAWRPDPISDPLDGMSDTCECRR